MSSNGNHDETGRSGVNHPSLTPHESASAGRKRSASRRDGDDGDDAGASDSHRVDGADGRPDSKRQRRQTPAAATPPDQVLEMASVERPVLIDALDQALAAHAAAADEYVLSLDSLVEAMEADGGDALKAVFESHGCLVVDGAVSGRAVSDALGRFVAVLLNDFVLQTPVEEMSAAVAAWEAAGCQPDDDPGPEARKVAGELAALRSEHAAVVAGGGVFALGSCSPAVAGDADENHTRAVFNVDAALDWFARFRTGANGHGCIGFGYWCRQFAKDQPSLELESGRIVVAPNPLWASNVRLMADSHPVLAALLCALCAADGPAKLSEDMQKVVGGSKMTGATKTLTPPHCDRYTAAVKRVQALVVAEETVKLFWVPGSHDPVVQQLIGRLLGAGDPGVTDRIGFTTVDVSGRNADLGRVLQRWARAAPSASLSGAAPLIVWTQGVIHFEGVADRSGGRGTDRLVSCARLAFPSFKGEREAYRATLASARRFRAVVGVHDASQLPAADRARLALAGAHHGMVADYWHKANRRRNAAVHAQTVCSKSTQYKRARASHGRELEAAAAINRLSDAGVAARIAAAVEEAEDSDSERAFWTLAGVDGV